MHGIPAESPQRRRTGDLIVDHVRSASWSTEPASRPMAPPEYRRPHSGATGRSLLDLPTAHESVQLGSHRLPSQDGVADHLLFDADQVGDLPTWDW
jgi:hypothetical protein